MIISDDSTGRPDNPKQVERDDAFTWVSLVDREGNFITGLGIGKAVDGSITVHFPGATIVESIFAKDANDVAVQLNVKKDCDGIQDTIH